MRLEAAAKDRAPKRHSPQNRSEHHPLGDRIDESSPKQSRSAINVAPLSRADPPQQHRQRGYSNLQNLVTRTTGDASPSTRAETENSDNAERNGSPEEIHHVVDLTVNDNQEQDTELAQGTVEDNSSTNVGSSTEIMPVSSSEQGQESPQTPRHDRVSPGRTQPIPSTPLQLRNRTKVVKENHIPRTQPRLPALRPFGVSTPRVPSEEDLYFLLLHRFRQRVQADKELTAEKCQLEIKNAKLSETVEEYQQQLNASRASAYEQESQLKKQKADIDDIKNRYPKIKDFMTGVYEDHKGLKSKVDSMKQDKQVLQDERKHIQHAVDEAKNATSLSSRAMAKIRTDLAKLRHETAALEIALHNTKLQLRNEQSLLAQERQRNMKFENHIAEIVRKHNSFSFTVEQGQQHLLNALKGIRERLGDLETGQAVAEEPPSLPALDQCVEMLTSLTQVETASPADVTDMIQAIQGLTER
jgi:archaellum component FlaC